MINLSPRTDGNYEATIKIHAGMSIITEYVHKQVDTVKNFVKRKDKGLTFITYDLKEEILIVYFAKK